MQENTSEWKEKLTPAKSEEREAHAIEHENQTEQKEEIESNPIKGKKPQKKPSIKVIALSILVSLSIVSIGGGVIFLNKTMSDKETEESQVTSLKTDFELQLAELESKVANIQESEVNQNSASVKNLSNKAAEAKAEIRDLKGAIIQLKKLITSMGETNTFNQQLVELLSKENDENKIKINKFENEVASLHKKINSTKSAQEFKNRRDENKPIAVSAINGATLFNIDLWGDENKAVFLKDGKTVKVRFGELFDGYLVTSIRLDKGVVTLSRKGKQYVIEKI